MRFDKCPSTTCFGIWRVLIHTCFESDRFWSPEHGQLFEGDSGTQLCDRVSQCLSGFPFFSAGRLGLDSSVGMLYHHLLPGASCLGSRGQDFNPRDRVTDRAGQEPLDEAENMLDESQTLRRSTRTERTEDKLMDAMFGPIQLTGLIGKRG